MQAPRRPLADGGQPYRPQNRAFATLHAAEEGDEVLYEISSRTRKLPCTVTDVGGTDEDGHYLALLGPDGGRPTLREEYENDAWQLYYYYGEGDGRDRERRRVYDLWFAAIDTDGNPDAATAAAGEAALSMLADEEYDYDLPRAAHEVARERVAEMDQEDVRALVHEAPAEYPASEGFNRPDHTAALVALEDRIITRHQGDADTAIEATIESMADYEKLVERGVSMARDYVSRGLADTISDAADQAAVAQLNDLSTADHLQIAEMAPPPARRRRAAEQLYRLVPWGDRDSAFEHARARLREAIVAQHRHEARQQLKDDDGRLRTWVDTFIDAVSGFDADTDELTMKAEPDIPLLADGGAPHTTVDEANLLLDESVPVVAGRWRLCDPGLVHDDENRQLIWCNEDTDEVVLTVGNRDDDGATWGTYVLDTNDTSTELYRGVSFTDALEAARGYVVPKNDGPQLQLTHNGTGLVTMDSDVDAEELGHAILNGDGGSDITSFIPSLARTLARHGRGGAVRVGRAAGTGARAAGAATRTAGGSLASDFWNRYEGRIGQLTLVVLVAALLQGVTKHVENIDSRIISRFDALGIDVIYRHAAPASAKSGSMGEAFGEREVEVIRDQLEVAAGPGWLVGENGVLHLRGTAESDEEGAHFQGTVNPWPVIAAGGTVLLAREAPRIGRFLREWGEVFHAEIVGGSADLDDERSKATEGGARYSKPSTPESSGGHSQRGVTRPSVSAEEGGEQVALTERFQPKATIENLVRGSRDDPNGVVDAHGEDPPGTPGEGGLPQVAELEDRLGDASRSDFIEMMLEEPAALEYVVQESELWPDHWSEDERDELVTDVRRHADNEDAWGDNSVALPGGLDRIDEKLAEALIINLTMGDQASRGAQAAMLEKFENESIGSDSPNDETWEDRKERKKEQKEQAAEQRRDDQPGQSWPTPPEEGEVTTETGGLTTSELVEQVEQTETEREHSPDAPNEEESFLADEQEVMEHMEQAGMYEDFEEYEP
jgi:hypothetical protein